jgi:hypothetical protein
MIGQRRVCVRLSGSFILSHQRRALEEHGIPGNYRPSTVMLVDSRLAVIPDLTLVKDIRDFIKPPENETLHGIWTPDRLHEGHQKEATQRGWREWTEGVPSHLVRSGILIPQREAGLWKRPTGTRTYYPNTTNLNTLVHPVTVAEYGMDMSAGSALTSSANEGTTTAKTAWVWTSPANEPDTATWPSPSTEDYEFQYEATLNDGSFSYGLLTIGGAAGHFGRVNAALTADVDTKEQDGVAETGTGVKLAGYDASAGAWGGSTQSDRFELLMSYQRADSHGTKTLTIQTHDADGWCRGPWAAAVVTRRIFIVS